MLAKIFSRKSTKNTCRRSIHRDIKPLKPEDFDDVFGGPPRYVFSRRSTVGFHPSDYFYDDMFHNLVRHGVDKNGQEDLTEFKISSTGCRSSEVFYGNDFNEVRRSKLDTTTVLNSEEFSPPKSDDDVYSPSYTPKFRPIIVQPTWNALTILMHGVQQRHQDIPDFPYSRPSFVGYEFTDTEQQTDYTSEFHHHHHDDDDDDDDDDENEISNSYVFDLNYSYREGSDEGVRVDEAISWVRESYQSSSSAEMTEVPDGPVDGSESLHLQGEYPNKMKTEKYQREVDESREMKMLEEDIKLWSSGKERNIELLLSTLQDILWPNSGWCPIPSTNLYQSSNVKKAYQKARLRLHPDKLQQRGATLLQKYIAERNPSGSMGFLYLPRHCHFISRIDVLHTLPT